MVAYRQYEHDDIQAVLGLCAAEDWPTLSADPGRTHRILTNPGVTSFVAVEGAAVVGFIYILSDGELQAYIASMAVAETHRRRGIGTSLIQHAAKAAGGERVDLLSAEDGFYERLVHKRRSGFRLYPPFGT